MRRVRIAILATLASAACHADEYEQARLELDRLYRASEQCVYDVRDRGYTYDKSPNCSGMTALFEGYTRELVAVGKDSPLADAPIEMQLKFQVAQTHAWMARAVEHGERVIW